MVQCVDKWASTDMEIIFMTFHFVDNC